MALSSDGLTGDALDHSTDVTLIGPKHHQQVVAFAKKEKKTYVSHAVSVMMMNF